MELLFCLAIFFIMREQIKKIFKIAFNFVMIPSSGFIFSLFLKIPFLNGIILVIVINKILKEFRTRFKDLNRLILSSRKRYEYGFIEKTVYMLLDMNFLVFVILIGVYAFKQLVSPLPNLDEFEILLLVFISAPVFRLAENYIKSATNDFIEPSPPYFVERGVLFAKKDKVDI